MAHFKAFAPGVEVNGESVLSIVDGMGQFRPLAVQILAQNHIVDPKPGQWYPQQAWLEAFKTISEKVGVRTLISIGHAIPATLNGHPTSIRSRRPRPP